MTGHVGALRLCVGKRWDFRGRPDVTAFDPRGRGAGATLGPFHCLLTCAHHGRGGLDPFDLPAADRVQDALRGALGGVLGGSRGH
jgi:hypothetical protein